MRASIIVLVLSIACGKRAEQAPPPPMPRDAAPAASARVQALVDGLRSHDASVRMKAEDELRDFKPSADEGLALLRASTLDFGDDRNESFGPAVQLVAAVHPDPRVTPVVEELFPKWTPALKTAGLELLSRIDDDAAAKAFVRLLPTFEISDPELLLSGLQKHPHHAQLIVPALVALSGDDDLHGEVYSTLLAYCHAGTLPALDARPLIAAYRAARDALTKLSSKDERFAETRERAALLLDLFRCVPTDDVKAQLAAALADRDARFAYFAATSLTALGAPVSDADLARIAASSEMRIWLVEDLQKKGELSRLPARYRSQAAIAESDMVRWLMFPTELGHAPDAIQLGKMIHFESSDGPADVFVFKIKTDDGWVAGVAGPYLSKDEPTTQGSGTFSAFEPWDAKSPEEHASAIAGITSKIH